MEADVHGSWGGLSRRRAAGRVARVALALALALAIGASAAGASTPPSPAAVRFAPERAYGPFVYESADGRIQGLSVDLLRAVAPQAGLQLTLLPAQDLGDILRGVRNGEVDLVSSLRVTPERSEYLAFTMPYVSVPAVLVMRRGLPHQVSLADMTGKPVGVGKGYAVEQFVRKSHPGVLWRPFANDEDAVRALAAGQVDGVVADAASVNFLRRQLKLTGIEVHDPVGFHYELCFAVPKHRTDLQEALARGLRGLSRVERDAIVERWIESEAMAYRAPATRWFEIAAWALAGLGAVGLGWVLTRRKRSTDDAESAIL